MYRPIITGISVFARVGPLQKAAIVRAFADDGGAITGMCGDGGNDCAALRGATFGFALSESDAGECVCVCVCVCVFVCVFVCVCVGV